MIEVILDDGVRPEAVTQIRLRGTRAIEDSVQCGNMEPHLVRLVELGLVTDDLVGGWKPTSLGVGVEGWNQQIRRASIDPRLILTEPREKENGQDILADCDEFREFLARREVAGAASIKLTTPVRWSNRRRNFCRRTANRNLIENLSTREDCKKSPIVAFLVFW